MPSGDDEQTPRELKTSEGGSTETGSKNEAEKVNLRAEAPTPDEINQPIEHVAVNAYEERLPGVMLLTALPSSRLLNSSC